MRWIEGYDVAVLVPDGHADGWPVDDMDASRECRHCDAPLGYGVPIRYADGKAVAHEFCTHTINQ